MSFEAHELSGGYTDSCGRVHRDVELVPLGGREEELLAQSDVIPSARLVTEVLRRCVTRIGGISPISRDIAADLLVGDRLNLLLQLRALTFGDEVEGKVFCPWPNCGCEVGVAFRISDIRFDDYAKGGPLYEMQLSRAALDSCDPVPDSPVVVFRLPCGRDQEETSTLLDVNEAKALTAILTRCVQSIGSAKATPEIIRALGASARREIENEIDSLSPDLEMTMDVSCPDCERQFHTPFDLQRFFFGELRTSADLLYREVHYLAFHYHWSEAEIMNLPRDRRRKYIEILADEIEQINSAHN